MKRKYTLLSIILLLSAPCLSRAVQIRGVEIPPEVTQPASKQTLVLNGSGIRTKFIFDIYIGSLYLTKPSKDVRQILAHTGSKRVRMDFLYGKIDKEKMVDGWLDGFKDNLSDEQFTELKPDIDRFNQAFGETVKGDVVTIDFIADLETVVIINNQKKTTISGAAFQKALLSIWLGNEPVDDDLKKAMLGIKEED
jgi:hypothetical protein